MKSEMQFTIARNSNDEVNLRIVDPASGIEFVDAIFTLTDYAMLVTGMGYVRGMTEVRGLEHVGKQEVREDRTVECPLKDYPTHEELRKWLYANCQEDGWQIDGYLGAHGSVTQRGGKMILRYRVFKYVDAEPPKPEAK